jgi:hypothetical protein
MYKCSFFADISPLFELTYSHAHFSRGSRSQLFNELDHLQGNVCSIGLWFIHIYLSFAYPRLRTPSHTISKSSSNRVVVGTVAPWARLPSWARPYGIFSESQCNPFDHAQALYLDLTSRRRPCLHTSRTGRFRTRSTLITSLCLRSWPFRRSSSDCDLSLLLLRHRQPSR